MVARFREEFLSAVKEVPIANKRVRMDALEATRLALTGMMEKLVSPSEGGMSSEERHEMLMCMRRMNETLCVAREEMEAKPLLIQQFNVSQYSGMSDEEVALRRVELVEKIRGSTGNILLTDADNQ